MFLFRFSKFYSRHLCYVRKKVKVLLNCSHLHKYSLFGIMTAVFEFRLPGVITQFASFMFSFMGRGICKTSKKKNI
jgi:hypothetical protein